MRKHNHRKAIFLLMMLLILFLLLSSSFISFYEEDEEVYTRRRKEMVRRQLKARDITDKKTLEAMEAVPRHLFVNPRERRAAYEDYPLPIDEG